MSVIAATTTKDFIVIAGLVPAIHERLARRFWITGIKPVMTVGA